MARSTANDLLERENQAGNAEDSLNVGRKNYDSQFSPFEDPDMQDFDAEMDAKYDESRSSRGRKTVDSHGDDVQSNYNADEPEADMQNVKNGEENPEGQWNTALNSTKTSRPKGRIDKIKADFKRVGPTGSLTGLLFGGGALVMVTATPTMLLVHMKEVFHNDRSDATRTNLLVTRAILSVAFKKSGGEDPCTGKSKISCKIGSAPKSLIDKYKKAGFTIDAVEVDKAGNETGKNSKDIALDEPGGDGNRYKINSIKFPGANGHVSTTGKDFHEYTDRSLEARRQATNANNPRSAFYKTKKFTKVLTDRLKIKNGKQATQYAEGETDEAKKQRASQFDGATDGASEADADSKAKSTKDKVKEETESKGKKGGMKGKGGGFLSLIQGVCAGYKTTKIGVATVKSMHMARLANFAMEYLKAADAIKAGLASAAMISYLSDKLTYVERNEYLEDGEKNPKYNLSATDSQGYKIAAHGDMTGLMGFANRYVLGGAEEGQADGFATKTLLAAAAGTAGLDAAMTMLVKALPGDSNLSGQEVIKNACRSASSVAALTAQCVAGAISITGAISAGTAGIGSLVGAAVGLKMCECTLRPDLGSDRLNTALDETTASATAGLSCSEIEKAISTLKNALIAATAAAIASAAESIIRNWNLGSDTKGVDAGNAIAAGAGMMLATAATSYALKPGTKSAHKNYVTYTNDLMAKYEELDKDDAKRTPFDATNKYSFLGTVVRSLKIEDTSKSPVFGNIVNLFNIIPSAMNSSVANALYSNPVQEPIQRYDCNNDKVTKDEDLAYLDVDGDKFCSIITYTPTAELESANTQAMDPESEEFQELRQWMESKQEKDENGGGTADNGSGCEKGCKGEASIDGDGKPKSDSQYAKFIEYCADRQDMWGTSTHPFEEGSDRDQDWFSGKQCLKETTMMTKFREWHRVCAQIAANQGTEECADEEQAAPTPTSSTCGNNGNTADIYTCALKYDDYGYLWGGGHGGNAQEFIANFNEGKVPKNTAILDCSGLVRMAFVEAMGIEDGAYVAPDGYNGSKYWDKISLTDAKQGDIITSDGHVAIVESNDTTGQTFKIFHASTSSGPIESNILHGTQSYSGTIAAYRAKKG